MMKLVFGVVDLWEHCKQVCGERCGFFVTIISRQGGFQLIKRNSAKFLVALDFRTSEMALQNILQLSHAAVLCFLFLPSLPCENLLCYFSPVLEIEKEKTFELIVTECPPKEVCFKGLGRYGNHTALSARGCMLEERCSRRVNIRLKGTIHTMTYSCCDWQFCNSGSVPKPVCVTLALVAIVVIVYGF